MKTKNTTRKLMLSAMFACLAYVLNTFVYFPAMALFQLFLMCSAPVWLPLGMPASAFYAELCV